MKDSVTWITGNWTSYPSNECCYIEAEEDDSGIKTWSVYQVNNGCLIKGFPKATEETFELLEQAQYWAMKNLSNG